MHENFGKNIKKTPWYLKPFFWNQKRKYGQILEPALIWARIPRLFLAVAAMYGVIDRKNHHFPQYYALSSLSGFLKLTGVRFVLILIQQL